MVAIVDVKSGGRKISDKFSLSTTLKFVIDKLNRSDNAVYCAGSFCRVTVMIGVSPAVRL